MFTIYSKPGCGHCEHAKTLLQSKGLPYEELILDVGQPKLQEKEYVTVNQLRQVVPNAMTMPQILENGRVLGGFGALKQFLTNQGL